MKQTRTTESDRIRSALAIFVGFGYLFYLAVSVAELGRDSQVVAGWFTPLAVPLAFGPGLALLVSAVLAPMRYVRAAAALCAVSYLVCIVLWFSAWNGMHVQADRATWLYSFPGLAALAACLVWRWPWVLGYLVVASVSSNVANTIARNTAYSMSYLPLDLASGMSFSALFVAAALAAIRTGERLDEARADAYGVAARDVHLVTRASERARFDRIVHDNVLYTLLLAARDIPASQLATTAGEALTSLLDRTRDDATEATLTGLAVMSRLRQTFEATDEAVPTMVDVDEKAGHARYPRNVVQAFEGAAGEALRNSIEHAGPGADREIVLRIESDAIDVVIADNGVGFDPSDIPSGRLGVQGSIIDCMRTIKGGSARVQSIPEIVTAVHLHWDRP